MLDIADCQLPTADLLNDAQDIKYFVPILSGSGFQKQVTKTPLPTLK